MNLVLLKQPQSNAIWQINDARQCAHLLHNVHVQVGDSLKVGILNQARYVCQVQHISSDSIAVVPMHEQPIAAKLPVTLIVALTRPKVLRRLMMDAVTLGVAKIVLLHSYRVDKSYWQSPFLQQLDHYVQLGLEQAGDVFAPEIVLQKRFKPFVEDQLAVWNRRYPTFVAHPYAAQPMPVAFNQPCQLLIGPEGGLIPYEIELLEKNSCQICTLGQRILRTETAVSHLLGRLFT